MREEPHKTLGRNVIPGNYKLTIDSDIKTFKFKGNVAISVDIKKPTRQVVLNAKELKINLASITSNGKEYAAEAKVDKKENTVTLSFGKPIKGKALITIDYSGKNNDEMYGLYRSRYSYKGKNGYILSTQFESTDARCAFPCFDEPEFKATFDLSLVIDNDLKALSNMPIKSEGKFGKKKKVTFNTTPRMSTYLLYIGIGKFEFLEGKLGSRSIRIVTTPGKIEYAKMALDFTKKFLSYYEGYFGVKYPLPKLDMIAVPDFAAGAMENWGAIAFREIEIIGNEKITSVAIKRRIAEVIAHEHRPPVVRRPGHDGVVGRSLAGRELCYLHGLQGGRPRLSRVADGNAVLHRHGRDRTLHGPTEDDAPDKRARQRAPARSTRYSTA